MFTPATRAWQQLSSWNQALRVGSSIQIPGIQIPWRCSATTVVGQVANSLLLRGTAITFSSLYSKIGSGGGLQKAARNTPGKHRRKRKSSAYNESIYWMEFPGEGQESRIYGTHQAVAARRGTPIWF
ncbi:unnamed protein product [Eretmochelys imbricata]